MAAQNREMAAYKAGERARRGKHKSRRKSMTVSVAMLGGFAPLGMELYHGYKEGGMKMAGNRLSMATTGVDTVGGPWRGDYALSKFYGPLLAGALAHKLANQIGVNRWLSRMKIPLLRI